MGIYSLIDILKLFFAICVVAIHSGICDGNVAMEYIISKGVFRLAVPFFFVASGFLLGIKLSKASSKEEGVRIIRKQIIRLLEVFVFWLLIGSIIYIKDAFMWDGGLNIVLMLKRILFNPWGLYGM